MREEVSFVPVHFLVVLGTSIQLEWTHLCTWGTVHPLQVQRTLCHKVSMPIVLRCLTWLPHTAVCGKLFFLILVFIAWNTHEYGRKLHVYSRLTIVLVISSYTTSISVALCVFSYHAISSKRNAFGWQPGVCEKIARDSPFHLSSNFSSFRNFRNFKIFE